MGNVTKNEDDTTEACTAWKSHLHKAKADSLFKQTLAAWFLDYVWWFQNSLQV